MDSSAAKQTSLKHSGRTNDTLMTLELLSSQPKLRPYEKKQKNQQITYMHTDGAGTGQRVPSTAVVSFRFCRQD